MQANITQSEKHQETTGQPRLLRRGFDLGEVPSAIKSLELDDHRNAWQQGQAILLRGLCKDRLKDHQKNIEQSRVFYEKVLAAQEECDEMLSKPPYVSRLEDQFESLGSSINEGDDQEIETVLFDAVTLDADDPKVLAEDLWMKASWLSFHEEDASLRFRFSFGVDLHEDVAADKQRQHYASLLTEAVFPESSLISHNEDLYEKLINTLGDNDIHFVERIVYFNSPNGGAYLHHDRERGHAGVAFAQLSGETFWLALPKKRLIQELLLFIQQCREANSWPESLDSEAQQELLVLVENPGELATQLESFANTTLIHLMNEAQEFVQHLIKQGYGKHLTPGDVLLLPQETDMTCCWHSVFCIGEESGQALSFAIRYEV